MIQNNIGVTKVFCKYDFCEVVFQVSFFFFLLVTRQNQTNKEIYKYITGVTETVFFCKCKILKYNFSFKYFMNVGFQLNSQLKL